MSSKGALLPGAAGRTPPVTNRTTRSNTKATAPQDTSPAQGSVTEKKKKKPTEVETEARKILTGEECLSGDPSSITHISITRTLTNLTQKYITTAPKGLTIALQALIALMQEVDNAVTQQAPLVETITLKLGACVEKAMHNEMNKLSSDIKTSITEQ
jgi:hypothetical protein